MTEVARRDVLRLLCASAVAAGVTSLTAGCSPDPVEQRSAAAAGQPEGTPFAGHAALTAALERIPRRGTVAFGVGVHDGRSGRRFVHDPSGSHEMASTVKVDLLVGLLLRAERTGRTLTAAERSRAATMIRVSDNAAAQALWVTNGGGAGMSSIWRSLGLTSMHPGRYGRWGLSTSSIEDRLRLLDVLAAGSGVLPSRTGDYALQLMSEVTDSQRWGVGAVACSGESVALKNGWLPRAAGGWIISSTGRVCGPSTDLRLAVLSHGHSSEEAGITFVEELLSAGREHLGV